MFSPPKVNVWAKCCKAFEVFQTAFSRLSEFGGRLEVNPPGANLKVYNEGNCANICGVSRDVGSTTYLKVSTVGIKLSSRTWFLKPYKTCKLTLLV